MITVSRQTLLELAAINGLSSLAYLKAISKQPKEPIRCVGETLTIIYRPDAQTTLVPTPKELAFLAHPNRV